MPNSVSCLELCLDCFNFSAKTRIQPAETLGLIGTPAFGSSKRSLKGVIRRFAMGLRTAKRTR